MGGARSASLHAKWNQAQKTGDPALSHPYKAPLPVAIEVRVKIFPLGDFGLNFMPRKILFHRHGVGFAHAY